MSKSPKTWMFSNEKLPKINKSLILLSALAGRWGSDWEKAFFNSKLALILAHQLRETNIISCASWALAEHLCYRSTPPALVLSQHSQVTHTHTWATAAQPLSLYQQGHPSPALNLCWHLQELIAWLGKHGQVSQGEGEHPTAHCNALQVGNAEQVRSREGDNKHYLMEVNSISHKNSVQWESDRFF